MAAVSALLVLALVGAISGGVLWAVAASGDSAGADTTAAAQREQFLTDATQAALNLTTVTPEDTDAMIANIRSSSTGDLAAELQDAAMQDQLVADVKQRNVTQIPKVVSISASELDADAGTGKALVFVAQSMSWGENQSAVRRQGISLDMVLVDDVWKVSSMAQLYEGVGASPGGGASSQPQSQPEGSGQGAAPAAENPAGS